MGSYQHKSEKNGNFEVPTTLCWIEDGFISGFVNLNDLIALDLETVNFFIINSFKDENFKSFFNREKIYVSYLLKQTNNFSNQISLLLIFFLIIP